MENKTTDLVEELYSSDAASALTNRAAREIERLRAELAEAEAALGKLING